MGILVGPTIVGETGALDPLGLAALLISPISWTSGSLYASHRATLPSQPLVATGLQMVCGAGVLSVMALLSGEPARFDPAAISRESLLALAYLTVIGSLLAFTVYGWLLRVAPLPWIATYAYVNPVVAVILGTAILNEPLDARTLVAGAVIVGAVALIVTARGRMQAPRGATDNRAGRAGTKRGYRPRRRGAAEPAQDFGRSKPCAGHGSQRSGRSSR